MQATNDQGMGNTAPERPASAPDVRNVRAGNPGSMLRRIFHTAAYERGIRAGHNEVDTGALAECPYDMPEMMEDFWRGVNEVNK